MDDGVITTHHSLLVTFARSSSQRSSSSHRHRNHGLSLSVNWHSDTITPRSMTALAHLSLSLRHLQVPLVAAVLLVTADSTYGQQLPRGSGLPVQDPTNNNSTRKKDDSETELDSPENEMCAKMILREEKKRYDENVARAKEVSQLALQVSQNFETSRAFTSDDGKRLERLEKLTKRIRNEAGGSDSEEDKEGKDIPGET